IGVQGGYGWGTTEHLFTATGIASGSSDISGGFAGASWGSSWQSGALVYGFDSDFSFANLDSSFAGAGCGAGGCFTDIRYFGTSRVRLGYAMERTLIYATGGLAYAGVNAGSTPFDGNTKVRYGWALGAGIEWALAPKWSAKLEYQH